jgi:hypothetical protein
MLTHITTTTLWRLGKKLLVHFYQNISFLKCRVNVNVHQYLMSILCAIKPTRSSSVREESRDTSAITNILVNLANYLQCRPLDKLDRWRDSEDCTAIL